jgi:eukaryotic translation initiation factor 2C
LPDLGGLKLTQAWPIRPGYGTRGAKVELTANYVELLPPSTLVLYRYDIAIIPEVAGRKAFRLVQLLLQSAELAPYHGNLATDFRSVLVSKTKLALDETVVEITYRGDGEDEPLPSAIVYKVRVKYTRALSMSGIINFLNSTNLSEAFSDKQELTQALNIFLNHYARSANNLAAIGSSKTFSLNQNPGRGDLGAGLEVIRGFFSSVRVATCRILVNINVSHGAFYHAAPLPALMHNYGTRSTVALEKFLKLVRVQTTHLPEKRNKAKDVIPRIKTIFGLARKDDGNRSAHPPRVSQPHGAGAKGVEFWLEGNVSSSGAPKAETQSAGAGTGKGKGKSKGKAQPESVTASGSGRYISVFDYFKTGTSFPCLSRLFTDCDAAYNIVLKHPELPVVNCGTREKPMYLPAEVCIVVPGQSSKAKLNGSQTQRMIGHAVRKPWENAASIVGQGIGTVGLDANTNLLLVNFQIQG